MLLVRLAKAATPAPPIAVIPAPKASKALDIPVIAEIEPEAELATWLIDL